MTASARGGSTIAEYMQKLQRILGDTTFARFNEYDLLDYINEARAYVASQGECVRTLCPSTAGVSNIAVSAPGAGYTVTAPTVVVSPPSIGRQATATADINTVTGQIVSFTITDPGAGYTVAPSVTLSGGNGTGGAGTATLMPFAQIRAGVEVYNFEDFSPLILSAQTGAERIIGIQSVSVAWGSMKPTLRRFSWSDFQAYLRAYNVGPQGYPRAWAQYQRGTSGSFYIWPIPSQDSQVDLDCICLPQDLDLQSNTALEPIPYPYTAAVPYKAAEIAVLGHPDLREMSDRFTAHYDRRMAFAGSVTGGTAVFDTYNPSGWA